MNKHRPHMFLAPHSSFFTKTGGRLTSHLTSGEKCKSSARRRLQCRQDTTAWTHQSLKASLHQAENAVVCRWGRVLFLCNAQMIKEFNTASRLMTPLGCRQTQERRRRGLQRILTKTGEGSKIYKFIHQNGAFSVPSVCACVDCVQVAESNASEVATKRRQEREDGGSPL